MKARRTRIEDNRSSPIDMAKMRLLFVGAALSLCYFAVCLRLVDLTLLRKPAEEVIAARESGEVVPLKKPLRGTILDRNGELVATSLKMASVFANATQVDNPKKLAHDLSGILTNLRESDLEKKLSSGKKFIWIARNITPKQEYAINALGNPALGFQAEDKRIYPSENLTAHLTGYTDVDGNGISGVEKAYNRELAEGEKPVQLTIDLRVQHLLHRELSAAMQKFNAKAAIGAVMDVNTGEIIAMVSLPDFSPYHAGEASADARFNRVTLGVFEMGSTFKLFSTAAALDSGKVNFNSHYDTSAPIKYGRFRISDYHSEKRALSVPEIFIFSSNIGTAKMALEAGVSSIHDFYERMGFFEQVPMAVPERGKPHYPKSWGEISTITASFGHGISVTPLHLMRAASALVNGGIMVKPRILYDEDARKLEKNEPEGDRVIKAETSAKIKKLLELTVVDGTGSKARVEGYHVGGKTGTAEKVSARGGYAKDSLFSSFLGFFPIQDPKYAVLAILDEPKGTKESYGYATGGWTGAPVVARVVEQMGPLYQMAPAFGGEEKIMQEMAPYLLKKQKKE